MVTRGCGVRIAGGIYFVTPTCEPGEIGCRPHTDYWLDPPLWADPDELGIGAQGMQAHPERPGDVVDWVGAKHYPNVMDVLSEIKQLGLSRRVQSGFDFSTIGHHSSIWLLHPRGWIDSGEEGERTHLWNHARADGGYCPKRKPHHQMTLPRSRDDAPMCAGLWRECVEGGQGTGDVAAGRTVTRKIGDALYVARRPPEGLDLSYEPAFIARYPIHHIEVVRNRENEKQEQAALQRARTSALDVEVVDE